MVMSQGQALSSLRCEATKVVSYSLFHGFQGLEPGALFGGMNTHTFQGTVIHGKVDSPAWPSLAVKVAVIAVPHISLTRSVVIVPSWTRGPGELPRRCGARSWFSRIRRKTRRFEVLMPA